jgi:elongation factor Ts
MTITTEQIKSLREATGAGVLDCRKALEASNGDLKQAMEALREKGLITAAKRSDRQASEGVVEIYSHGNGRIGVMVEVNSETDFVGRSEAFRKFAHEVALQVAASAPRYVRPEDIPADVLEQEREKALIRARTDAPDKPETIIDRIVEGRLEVFKKEVCLMLQPYIRDEDMPFEKVLHQTIAALNENIVVRRFVRWQLGESTAS